MKLDMLLADYLNKFDFLSQNQMNTVIANILSRIPKNQSLDLKEIKSQDENYVSGKNTIYQDYYAVDWNYGFFDKIIGYFISNYPFVIRVVQCKGEIYSSVNDFYTGGLIDEDKDTKFTKNCDKVLLIELTNKQMVVEYVEKEAPKLFPRFITVEGIDGSGKTTAVQAIKEWFDEKGMENIVVRQNKDTFIGESLRDYFTNHSEEFSKLNADTHALLFTASIASTIDTQILPALKDNKVVISDRFTLSTRVYQKDSNLVNPICNFIEARLSPGLIFLLDVPINTVRQRRLDRAEATDALENVEHDVEVNRRLEFLRLSRERKHRVVVIDASLTQDSVKKLIQTKLQSVYG